MTRKPILAWKRDEKDGAWLLCVGRRAAATVWDNGTWHTWDRHGNGGENSSEEFVQDAKKEALYSAMMQGFL